MRNKIQQTGFGARARVIDLLGREQIADAPTAISELLKNAVDARARHATLSFSSDSSRLDIKDDGLGMRTRDVLDKWLVVATESRREPEDQGWLMFASKTQQRKYPPLGEKGIGRLAIAALGSGVLLWTRWGVGPERQATMLLLHWGVFRHPKLSLEQIRIPYRTYEESEQPDRRDAYDLIDELENWMTRSNGLWKDQQPLCDEILLDLKVNFRHCLNEMPHLEGSPGTLFSILRVTPEVEQMFSTEVRVEEEVTPNEALKLVLGFNDFLTGRKPRLAVSFERDYREVAAERSFWRLTDLERADHEIDVSCDQDGFVSGRIRVYGDWHEYELSPGVLPDRSRFPGPFHLRLGYIAGKEDTRLTPDDFRSYDERLKAYGALYVYRDDIRVLPYGQQDNDFLRFELRRSLNAGRYFFSHRRMFGVLELTTAGNPELRDKAGREGFIKNGAYRGLVFILTKTFVDLARTYYGSDSRRDSASERRSERQEDAAERAKEQADRARAEFLSGLARWREELPKIIETVTRKLKEFTQAADAAERAHIVTEEDLQRCEALLRSAMDYFGAKLAALPVEIPAVVVLSPDQVVAFDAYAHARDQMEDKIAADVAQASVCLATVLSKVEGDRARAALFRRWNQASSALKTKIDQLDTGFRHTLRSSLDLVPRWRADQQEILDEPFKERFPNGLEQGLAERPIGKSTTDLEEAIRLQQKIFIEKIQPFWQSARLQFEKVADADLAEIELGKLYRGFERLREREQILAELAQLGLVIETLDHDYYMLFARIHSETAKIGRLARSGPAALTAAHRALESALGSLELKQGFLRPLFRQNFGSRGDLMGEEIIGFVNGFYVTEASQLVGITVNGDLASFVFPDVNKAVVLAAIVNIVQNGLYWSRHGKGEPEVRLTLSGGKLVISNSGPKISDRDHDRIFEPFFTRRPGGRGLGLYIARSNLESSGLVLYVDPSKLEGTLDGARFVIERSGT